MTITKKSIEAFVLGKKPEEKVRYYLKVFKQIESGQIRTWNWAAALSGEFWAIYRGMYLYGFFLLLFWLVSDSLAERFLGDGWIYFLITLLVGPMTWGLLGNRLYFYFYTRKGRQEKEPIGTHPWMTVLSVFLWVTLRILIGSLYNKF